MAKKVKPSFYFSILLKFQALVCFGDDYFGDTRKSCEIFDGSSSAPTFAAEWSHAYGALGLFKNQPATVGCGAANHQKAETLSSTGWTALPDFPLSVFNYFEDFYFFRKISSHSLVGLENGAMMLLGGYDWENYSLQTGIWKLKEEKWIRIGEFSKV
jgi:hypothetical protein